MKNTKLKYNANFVGADSISGQNEKGITLIALIITIIVMLILVGVTINVALNGGIFDTAQKAATGTQKEIEKERLTEIAIANYNVSEGKISNAEELANKIKTDLKFDKEKITETKLVVKGATGTLWQIDLNTAEVKEKITGIAYKSVDGNAYIIITSDNEIIVKDLNGTVLYGEDIGLTVTNGKVDWNSLGVTKIAEPSIPVTAEVLEMLGVDHFPPTLEEVKNHQKFMYENGEISYFVSENYIVSIYIKEDGSLVFSLTDCLLADNETEISDILD